MPPKAAPRGRRRPAAAGPPRRRPGASERSLEDEEKPAEAKALNSLTVQGLKSLGPVCLQDARYYGRLVSLAGRLGCTKMEDGEMYVDMEVTGTKDDELLRVLSGKVGRKVSVHICSDECGGLLTDPLLVHGRSYEEIELRKVPWSTNLEAAVPEGSRPVEDQLAELRKLQEQAQGVDKKDKKATRRREKKKRSVEDLREDEGRPEGPPRVKEDAMELGQKSLKDVYSGTGLDPEPAKWQKILKRAKRIGKSKKKKKKKGSGSSSDGSSSTSSSSSSSQVPGGSGLFDEEDRLQRIWKRYPGALTAGAIREARQGLMNQAGTLWNISHSELPPLFTQYSRQQVIGALPVSPALTQELLTLSQCLDHLLMGKIAAGADILCQRIKCVESLAKGYHWSVGRQLELVHSEQNSIAEGSEALTAARKAKEEEKLKSLVSKGGAGRGGESYGTGKGRKGKDKYAPKGRSDESGKGRGGDHRARDDGKPAGKKN